jgi:hypothetical protein
MSWETITTNSQQFNPLTWDIQFNPASWGLNMRDIDEASLNLKTAIYAGNINLTADFYQQIKALSDRKYNAINPDGSIATWRLTDTDMTGKNPGLYMNQSRMGFWSGTEWKAFIGNSGDFSFDGNLTNYIRWNSGTGTLDIRGKMQIWDIEWAEAILNGLGDMAYENMVEISKLGSTVIEWGYIKTWLISADRIDTGVLNADRIAANSITLSKITGLWTLATQNSVNYATDIIGTPVLWTLAWLNTITYNWTYITGLPTLWAMAAKDVAAWSTDISWRSIELTDWRILLWIDANWYIQQIVKGSMLPSVGMVTWLNITWTHMWYYNGTTWWAYIQSDWKFYFNWDANNYIQWDWWNLAIKWNIVMTWWSLIWSTVTGAGRPADNATVWADWNTNVSNKPTIPTVPGYITSTKITGTTIEACTLTGNTLNTTVNSSDQIAGHVAVWNGEWFYVDQYGSSMMISMTAFDDGSWYRWAIKFYDWGSYIWRMGWVSGSWIYVEADLTMAYWENFSHWGGGAGTATFSGKLKIPVWTNLY